MKVVISRLKNIVTRQRIGKLETSPRSAELCMVW